MKDDDSLNSVCATATLELGIDIGRLERAFQIDAPFTVSGFLQRMGRTGRRGSPSEMWFVMREEHPEARAMLPDMIPWYLLQGIALVQLYVEERFVEPPRTERLPFSLLYHQTMSTLASGGEMTPAELASRVLTLSVFHRITKEDFRLLLLHLLEIDHINRTENGGLIVGLTGERVVNNHKFYAVFQENVEYTVRSGSEELGTLVKPPPVGEKIAERLKITGLSQNKLAKAAQLSQSGLSSIINGKVSPKEETVRRIAEVLGCSIADLVDDDAPASPAINYRYRQLLQLAEMLDDEELKKLIDFAELLCNDSRRSEKSENLVI